MALNFVQRRRQRKETAPSGLHTDDLKNQHKGGSKGFSDRAKSDCQCSRELITCAKIAQCRAMSRNVARQRDVQILERGVTNYHKSLSLDSWHSTLDSATVNERKAPSGLHTDDLNNQHKGGSKGFSDRAKSDCQCLREQITCEKIAQCRAR